MALSSSSNEAAKTNRPKPRREPSQLSLTFQEAWKRMGGPELTPEYRFHGERKFRFDFVHLPTMIVIELEGGIFTKGRHSRPKGMQMDADKYNLAGSMGYLVFRLTTGQITHDRLQQIIHTISSRAHTNAPP